jgi:hypothetical protein
LEDRVIHSRDYVRPGISGPSETPVERRVVTRKLQQAMIPGPELVRVQRVQGLGLGLGLEQQQGLSSPAGTTPAANNQAIFE